MIRLALVLFLLLSADHALAARRIAVVVGANAAPPGRAALRYAHADAHAFARMLIDVGEFGPADVHVLLDPAPEAMLRRLDEVAYALASADESLLLVYYSGHADHGALYPAGKALPLAELKRRLEGGTKGVRMGILDACRGGAFTGAKGLHPDKPFDVDIPLALGSEGSVLVASSSGLEDAHEAAHIGGSFFTHHLVAGLRGAADRSGDGAVTVNEAFDYAQRLTIRDSALHATTPQTPSFEFNLRGRHDIALTRIAAGASRFALHQATGPLQVIRLDTGLVVVELPPGRRQAVVALPPGSYLVRRRSEAGVFAREIELPAGGQVDLHEEELHLVGHAALATKGAMPTGGGTSLRAGEWQLRAAAGRIYDETSLLFSGTRQAMGHTGFELSLDLGITDRLTLSIEEPGLSYRFGDAGEAELLVWAGLPFGLAITSIDGSLGHVLPRATATGRLYLGPRQSLLFGLGMQSAVSWVGSDAAYFETLRFDGQAGYLLQVGDAVTLGFGMSASQRFAEGRLIERTRRGFTLEFGSALELASRSLPLVQVHVLDSLSLDGYATVGWDLPTGTLHEQYLGGITWTF